MAAASVVALVSDIVWTKDFLIGLAAMAGDLFSSFVKRRMGYLPSSRAFGLDQIPEALFAALAYRSLLARTVADIILVVALFFAGGLILSHILFKMQIRGALLGFHLIFAR